MAATLKLIKAKVGPDGQVEGTEVRRVLQLLRRAGLLAATASLTKWSKEASTATLNLHKAAGLAAREGFDPGEKSDALLELCKRAGVVLPLRLGAFGAAAFFSFWDAAVQAKVPYAWSGIPGGGDDKVAYGLDSYEQYLIFTLAGASSEFDPDPAHPMVAMNCISFVNLALSIWKTGAAHAAPYDAAQNMGGFNPIAGRYRMSALRPRPMIGMAWDVSAAWQPEPLRVTVPSPLRPSVPREAVQALPGSEASKVADTYFYSSQDVLRETQPGKLYHAQWCYRAQVSKNGKTLPAGFGHHDTLLYDGNIYEINLGTPYLRCTPLGARMNQAPTEALRIFGPA